MQLLLKEIEGTMLQILYVLTYETPMCVQAAQAEKSAQTAQYTAAAGPQLEQDEGDDLDPNQYHERRLRALETAKAAGRNPYPHKFQISMLIPEYVAKYANIEAGSRSDQQRESLAGAACCLLSSKPPLHLCLWQQVSEKACTAAAARAACTSHVTVPEGICPHPQGMRSAFWVMHRREGRLAEHGLAAERRWLPGRPVLWFFYVSSAQAPMSLHGQKSNIAIYNEEKSDSRTMSWCRPSIQQEGAGQAGVL